MCGVRCSATASRGLTTLSTTGCVICEISHGSASSSQIATRSARPPTSSHRSFAPWKKMHYSANCSRWVTPSHCTRPSPSSTTPKIPHYKRPTWRQKSQRISNRLGIRNSKRRRLNRAKDRTRTSNDACFAVETAIPEPIARPTGKHTPVAENLVTAVCLAGKRLQRISAEQSLTTPSQVRIGAIDAS